MRSGTASRLAWALWAAWLLLAIPGGNGASRTVSKTVVRIVSSAPARSTAACSHALPPTPGWRRSVSHPGADRPKHQHRSQPAPIGDTASRDSRNGADLIDHGGHERERSSQAGVAAGLGALRDDQVDAGGGSAK
jgi:hypothetical protein